MKMESDLYVLIELHNFELNKTKSCAQRISSLLIQGLYNWLIPQVISLPVEWHHLRVMMSQITGTSPVVQELIIQQGEHQGSVWGVCSPSQTSGPRFNIKMISYQHRKSHCRDKTILRPSYLHNGISYTGKMTSLYWIRAQVSRKIFWLILLCFLFIVLLGTHENHDLKLHRWYLWSVASKNIILGRQFYRKH